MKYILSISLCCSFLFLYETVQAVSDEIHPLNSGSVSNSCIELITWKIGSVDSRYNIEEETLKKIMAEVSKLWSVAVGRRLIVYSDSGDVTLNLIYSGIQKYTEDKQKMMDQIKKMKKKYALMRMKHQQELRKLQNELDKPQNSLTEYMAKVNRYNDKFNKLSYELNLYANEVNELIYQYNNHFHLKKTFYQATFNTINDPKRINIYQFENINRLKLVLAHEAGHVLGLPHTDSLQAIMNYRMQFQDEKKLQLADDDIRKIRNRCPRLTDGTTLIKGPFVDIHSAQMKN